MAHEAKPPPKLPGRPVAQAAGTHTTSTINSGSDQTMPMSKVNATAGASQTQPLEPSPPDALCQPVDNLHLTSTQAMKDWNETVIANMKRMSEVEEYRLEVSKKLS